MSQFLMHLMIVKTKQVFMWLFMEHHIKAFNMKILATACDDKHEKHNKTSYSNCNTLYLFVDFHLDFSGSTSVMFKMPLCHLLAEGLVWRRKLAV